MRKRRTSVICGLTFVVAYVLVSVVIRHGIPTVWAGLASGAAGFMVADAAGRLTRRALDGPPPVGVPAAGLPPFPGPFAVVLHHPGTRKIHAIKIIREHTRLGLKEAKDVVDAAPATLPLPSWEAATALSAALAAIGATATPAAASTPAPTTTPAPTDAGSATAPE